MFKVDTDIPIPQKDRSWNRYPWATLEVGHSFFGPGKSAAALASAASNFKRRTGKDWDFTSKVCNENGVIGARIWRVK